MAENFPGVITVRPAMIDVVPGQPIPAPVDTAALWNVLIGSSLIVVRRLFTRWREYRRTSLPIEGSPSGADSLLEMDSPGSRLDGAAAAEEATATESVQVQEGQVFLKEAKIREKKFEERFAQMQLYYEKEFERMKLGMDSRNQEVKVMQEEIQRKQSIILEQNKFPMEITQEENRKQRTNKEKQKDEQSEDMVHAFYECDKKEGKGSWKGSHAQASNYGIPDYNLATPRTTIQEAVDIWIKDVYIKYGGYIAEKNVTADGQVKHNWGKLVKERFKELKIAEKDIDEEDIDFSKITDDQESAAEVHKTPKRQVREIREVVKVLGISIT